MSHFRVHHSQYKHWIVLVLVGLVAAVLAVSFWRGAQSLSDQEKLLRAVNTTLAELSSEVPKTRSITISVEDQASTLTLAVEGVGSATEYSGSGNIDLLIQGTPVSFDVSVLSVGNKTYIQPKGLAGALDDAIKKNSQLQTYQTYDDLIAAQLENQWIEIDQPGGIEGCSQQLQALMQESDVQSVLKQLPFEVASTQPNKTKYSVSLSQKQLNTLFEQLKSTGLYSSLKQQCAGLDVFQLDAAEKNSVPGSYRITLTVNEVNNQITQLMVKTDNRSIEVEHSARVTEKTPSKVTKPERVVTLDEAKKSLENIIGSPALLHMY